LEKNGDKQQIATVNKYHLYFWIITYATAILCKTITGNFGNDYMINHNNSQMFDENRNVVWQGRL
jgi:hypothetical protein